MHRRARLLSNEQALFAKPKTEVFLEDVFDLANPLIHDERQRGRFFELNRNRYLIEASAVRLPSDGDPAMVSLSLAYGIDPNEAKQPDRVTPLFFAHQYPYKNAELLLAHRADTMRMQNTGGRFCITLSRLATWNGQKVCCVMERI
jgi:hypothetical protein